MAQVVHLDTARTWRGGQLQVFLLHREFLRMSLDSRLLARANGALHRRCEETGLQVEPIRLMRAWYPPAIAAVWRHTRRAAIVHAHDSHAASLAAMARVANSRLSVVCHRRVAYPLHGLPNGRWKYRSIDRWIAVSTEIASELRDAGVQDLRVIHSAVDFDNLEARRPMAAERLVRSELDLDASSPVIGLFGALAPQKGHVALITAAPKILAVQPRARFLCVGDGPLRNQLRRHVRRQGLERAFRFTGFRRDVATLMNICAVVAVPSLDGEGSSAVIKEAVVLGAPVIASDLPGNKEVLDDWGITIPVADEQALAGAVLRVLNDATCTTSSGHRQRRWPHKWTPGEMAASMLGAYEGLGQTMSPKPSGVW
jgi:glycosyltransferase involved in cell wall biosynthesis